jgi:Skp family chaperone for outer membrane proteins
MNFFLRLLFLTLLLSCSVNAEDFTVKVAIVDVQFILENSIAMQKIQEQIENISKTIEKNVSQKEVEFKKIEEDLIKKKNTLNEQEFEKLVNDFNKKVTSAQQDIQSKKVQLEQAHSDAVGKVHEIIISIINDLAKKYNVNLILPSSQILYASPKLNITKDAIEQLNNQIKNVEVKY